MSRRGKKGFVWRGVWREGAFANTTPAKPCLWVDEPIYLRVKAYAEEQGISMQRALDRVFGMERNGPAEKRRAVENRARRAA